MRAPQALLVLATAALTLTPVRVARADDAIQVLRGRCQRTGLSGTGNGGSIDRVQLTVDLRVQPLAYEKIVGIRSTLDDWTSSTDTRGYWVENFADGFEHWRVDVDAGTVGTNVVVGAGRGSLGPAWFRYAAFSTMKGATHWDNGQGRDHAVAVLAPRADPLPEARLHPTPLLVGDALYLIGGRSPESYGFEIPDVQMLDASGAWTKVADLPALALTASPGQPASPELFSHVEAASVSGKLYVAAGEQIHVGGWPLGTAGLDLATGQWTACALLPGPLFDRRAIATATGYQLVPAAADRSLSGDPSRGAYVYDSGSDTWTTQSIAGLDLLTGSHYTAVVVSGKLLFFGGSDAFAYDPATFTVKRLASPPFAIASAALAVALGSSQVAIANAAPDATGTSSDLLVYDTLANAFTVLGNQPCFSSLVSLAPVAPALVGSPAGSSQTVAPFLVLTGTSRIDSCEPFAGVLAEGVSRTTLRVRAPSDATALTLRGSSAPLSWTAGTPMTPGVNGLWTWSSTEVLDPSFRWKPLANDARWYPYADLGVAPGSTVTIDGSW